MPTIEFNNFWMQGFGQRVFRVETDTVGTPGTPSGFLSVAGMLPGSSGNGMNGRLMIMKGTIPSNFSTLTTFQDSGRSADLLITFKQPSVFLTPVATNPLVISSTGVNASASGTATWFWIANSLNDGWGWPTSSIYQQAIGTVGLRGSGADLEISDTNIVSGQTYRINSLKINFPSSYTY